MSNPSLFERFAHLAHYVIRTHLEAFLLSKGPAEQWCLDFLQCALNLGGLIFVHLGQIKTPPGRPPKAVLAGAVSWGLFHALAKLSIFAIRDYDLVWSSRELLPLQEHGASTALGPFVIDSFVSWGPLTSEVPV